MFWRTQDMMAARKGDWKYVRWESYEYLANLAEDETENANFKLKNPAMFEQLKRAYEDWDKQMLPIPPRSDAARRRARRTARAISNLYDLSWSRYGRRSQRRLCAPNPRRSGRAKPAAQPGVRRTGEESSMSRPADAGIAAAARGRRDSMMDRRVFIGGLTLGTLAVPRGAPAQPARKVYRIGILSPTSMTSEWSGPSPSTRSSTRSSVDCASLATCMESIS